MGLISEPPHSLSHTLKKERLCIRLAAVSVRSGNKLFSFRYLQCREDVGKDGLNCAPEPDIEEV